MSISRKRSRIMNPNGTITLNEALLILKGKSAIKKMGIRIAAIRDKFKSNYIGIGKEKFLLNEVKFKQWIAKTIDAIPDGFIPIAEITRELGITSAYVYTLIKKHKIKIKKLGPGKGKVYADFATLRKIRVEMKHNSKLIGKENHESGNDDIRKAFFHFQEYVPLGTKKEWRIFTKALWQWGVMHTPTNKMGVFK